MAESGEWLASINPKGKVWYYNKVTGVTTFQKPAELDERPAPAHEPGPSSAPFAVGATVCLKCKAQGHFTKDCPQLYIRPPQERDPSPSAPKPGREDRMADPPALPLAPYSLPAPYPYVPPTYGYPMASPAPYGPYYGPPPPPPPGFIPLPGPPMAPFMPQGAPPVYPSPPHNVPAPHYPPQAPSPPQRPQKKSPVDSGKRIGPRKGSRNWSELPIRDAPAAPPRPLMSHAELEKQAEHASAKVEVLQQASAQRDGIIQVLQQEVDDLKEQMDRVRLQADEAQKERDSAYGEMESVLEQHEQERQTLATQLFRGMSEEDARSILTPEQFQRWFPVKWRAPPVPVTTEPAAPPMYPPRPPPGPRGLFGPSPVGYAGFSYGPAQYPFHSGGYGYPFGY
eukprot:GGOE01005378.1.p1 GENE.GGOE01005378.1~~GGOE01005378.1.p1  ORF type:complete len:396 (-),score=44.54 GGOE01005378.1:691-1878(-)